MIVLISISSLLAFAYYLLMSKYARLWKSIRTSKAEWQGSVNVLIPFRNEENYLAGLIASLNTLNFPVEQVKLIFINDHSEDESVKLIQSARIQFPYQLLNLTEGEGKKDAIKLAWKHCDAQIIVHTDADSSMGPDWLNALLSGFANEQIKFVSAPVDYYKGAHFWSQLLRLDFISLIGIGASHIQWKHPLICNGANLAYRAEVLNSIDMNEGIASGDDVFLMQSIAESYPNSLHFSKDQAAMVLTQGPENFNAFFQQRLRWAGKNRSYKSRFNTLILGFSWIFNVLILCSLLSFSKIGFLLFVLLICVKLLAETKFYESTAAFFELSNWWMTLLKGQLFHIIYMALLPPLSAVLSYQWKGRKKK